MSMHPSVTSVRSTTIEPDQISWLVQSREWVATQPTMVQACRNTYETTTATHAPRIITTATHLTHKFSRIRSRHSYSILVPNTAIMLGNGAASPRLPSVSKCSLPGKNLSCALRYSQR